MNRLRTARRIATASVFFVAATAGLVAAQPKDPDRDIRPKPIEPMPQRVELTASDGVQIVATYYPPLLKAGPKSPAAILVHMYPADRKSWQPIAPRLSMAGFAVLAYDIRGTGESVADPSLAQRYKDRDPALFKSAWKDAEAAAKWLAERPDVDGARLVMIGASVGCSISIDYCGRDPHVRAVACLSPGLNYMNLDTTMHIRLCGKRPILLIAPEAEREAPEALAKIGQNVTVDIRPGTREQHGTYMFEQAYNGKLMNKVVEFVHKAAAEALQKEQSPERPDGRAK